MVNEYREMKSLKELKCNLKQEEQMKANGSKVIPVTLLGDTATQLLATAIKGEAVERGFVLDLYEAEYNQIKLRHFNGTTE